MILVDLQHIPEGTRLARPVFSKERPSQPLLQVGTDLTPAMGKRLAGMGIPLIWVKGSQCDKFSHSSSSTRGGQSDDSLAQVGALLSSLRMRITKVLRSGPRELKPLELSGCVQALASGMSHGVSQEPPILQLSWNGNDLAAHLANTTYYSFVLATNLPRYLREQRSTTGAELWTALGQLGLAAALHDVGKLVMKHDVWIKNTQTSPNELTYGPDDKDYLKHPQAGADAFREGLHSAIVYTISSHHLRYTGNGFPTQLDSRNPSGKRGIMRKRIHIFARIVALANAIDHCLGRDLRPHEPVQRLCELCQLQKEGRFDPVLFTAAIRLIPAFPEGTQVRLSDGRLAVVAGNNVYAPCQPTVLPLEGENQLPVVRAEPIDLRANPEVQIAEVGGVDVRPYFYEPERLEPDPLDYWALRDVLNKVPLVESGEKTESVPA